MLLPFTNSLRRTTHRDPECAALADRHYPRQTVGSVQFTPPAKKLILRDALGLVVFAWIWSRHRFDEQKGFNCSIFRNESKRLSSEIILEAERFAVEWWGPGRAFTFVDAKKLQTRKRRGAEFCPFPPGQCFTRAGWRLVGISKKRRKHILEKFLED